MRAHIKYQNPNYCHGEKGESVLGQISNIGTIAIVNIKGESVWGQSSNIKYQITNNK